MLKHLNVNSVKPTRVVILGLHGFVASNIARQLKQEGVDVLSISKNEINLLEIEAGKKLSDILRPTDTLVIVAAKAPCKTNEILIDNLKMIQAVGKAIESTPPAHCVYISSDAVYADDVFLATETSNASPSSLHGMMHSCRELMMKQLCSKIPLAILRPSLLYGIDDPHNGYGPNRFRRLAEKGEKIVLFGSGEEKRDHILIQDVAKIVSLVIHHRSEGILNIATGESYSFHHIAQEIINILKSASVIEPTPRNNPITHRHFDISACHKAFPDFRYTALPDGLKQVSEESAAMGKTTGSA
jgi:UDP-glucose 4-epimerase